MKRLVLLALALACALPPAAAAAAPAFGDGDGLHVVSQERLDPRLVDLTVTTAALPGPAHVRVLLPADYSANPGRRYPVLYLLHGTSGGAADWTEKGGAEQTTAGLPLIVVMPDIALNYGGGGWCTDWYNGGSYGPPEWETFHIRELLPWIDQNLRTIPTRAGRAIAGLSQGGFCSTSYAARHPDLFATALAYSGAPDIAYDEDAAIGSTVVIGGTEIGLDRAPLGSMFGDRLTQEVNYADHDPATLAENLRDTGLFLFTGNGLPGPYDPPPPDPGAMSIEGAIWRDNQDFQRRLESLGIPSFYDDYGAGTHSWPYWERDLRESIGPVMDRFAHPPAPPAQVTYTTADARYSVYGWDVTMRRGAEEFSTLRNASAVGFALAGSGSGEVVTPPGYLPGAAYAVKLSGLGIDASERLRADPHGRLRIDVPLGPPNPYQEYTPQAELAGTAVYTTRVTIARG
jgi:S-formylglutathione hydrolase FrmB